MAYIAELSGRKLQNKMGGQLNERASAPVSTFAQKMLENMGWKEGEGLGKNASGITTHIKAKKREELQGIGQEKEAVKAQADTWWNSELEKTLYMIKQKKELKRKAAKEAKKKKKKKKKSGQSSSDDEDEDSTPLNIDEDALLQGFVDKGLPTDDQLFKATGGARLGMRAQRRANGKFARAEGDAIKDAEANVVAEWDGMGAATFVGKKEERKRKRKLEAEEEEKAKDVPVEKTETKEKKEKKEKKQKKSKDKA